MRYVPTSLTEATCDILDYTSNNIADSTLYIDKQVTHQGQSFKVKNICPAAFYKNQGIKKLSINIEGIIGDMAFKNCSNLESLTINSISSIGKDAFSKNTKLKHTSLNNHINSIGENAFEYCKSLQHFTIPDSVSVIERKVFQFCSSLEDIIIHKNIKVVKSEAFYSCKNLSVVTIEDQEDTIKFEKNSSFNYCNIDSVYIGANIYNSIFDNTTELPFQDHKTLRAIRISGKKSKIEPIEFSHCTNLQHIYMDNSVKSIAELSFCGCKSIKEIIIPDSVKTIEHLAFIDCQNLEKITFGSGLEKLGGRACHNLSKLREITSKATIPPYCFLFPFSGISKECKLIVPEESIKAYKQAYGWKYFFDDATTTDIKTIPSHQNQPIKIYKLNGTLIYAGKQMPTNLHPGIYIINGKTINVQ